jgi:hypothetical protein
LLRILDKKPLEMAPPSVASNVDKAQENNSAGEAKRISQSEHSGFSISISNKSVYGWYDVVATSAFSPGRRAHGRLKISYSKEYISELLDHLSRNVQNSRGERIMVRRSAEKDDAEDEVQDDHKNEAEEPIDAFGHQLYCDLFSRDVELLYVDAVEKASAQFPIRIIADAPEVKRLPWEFLHDKRGFICTNVGPIFRVVPGAKPSTSDLLVTEPLKLLIVPSNPPGSVNLNVEEEEEIIRSTLQKTDIEIYKPNSQKVDAFREKLLSIRPHIIHFIGHGDKTGIRFKSDRQYWRCAGRDVHCRGVLAPHRHPECLLDR